ncbi:MAG: ATP-dependent DNA helicase [Thermodesulfobacteriota bacterium]|nr:ATP-dependent DNA helicase [Thermodesulfobacteriota bacterium]
MRLNENQQKAVSYTDGPLLVLAGAGTGKTSVIAHRTVSLIQNKGINPGNILALTFSNKATLEMRNRIEQLLDRGYDDIWISTFHSFCAEVLRENALEFGISPFFKLITEPEQLSLMVTNVEKLNIRYYEVKGSPHGLLQQMLSLISRAKDEMITPDEYTQFATRLAGSDKGKDLDTLKIIEEANVYSNYQRLLMEHDFVDFGDLILYTISGFKEKSHILRQYQKKFQYILVDEFQDTNFAQGQLLDMLATSHRNLCVVGDDDQSIYRFRGASIKNILDFERRYPDAEVVTLDENYRSSQEILDASHALIGHNQSRRDKRLKATFSNGLSHFDSIQYQSFATNNEQAEHMAREIRNLLAQDESLGLSDIAVLLRSIKTQSQLIAAALEREGIPYNLIGGSGFFERKEIKDILSWLKAIENPFDTENLVRAMDASPFRISPIHVCRISNWGKSNSDLPLFDALMEVESIPKLDTETIEEVQSFKSLIQDLIEQKETVTAGEIARQTINKIRYRERLLGDDTAERMISLTNLHKLESMADDFFPIEGYSNLRSFLVYLSYLMPSGEKAVELPLFEAVNIMTIHQAKGLEFRVVFIPDLAQSRFPGSRRHVPIDLPNELLKEELPDASSREVHLSEQRRLFYVGMTRAKERLYLFHAKRYKDEHRENKPSQFIQEAIEEPPKTGYCDNKADISLECDIFSGFNLVKTSMDIASEVRLKKAFNIDFKAVLKDGMRSQIAFMKSQLLSEEETEQFEGKLRMINKSIRDVFAHDVLDVLLDPCMDRELRDIFSGKINRGKRAASKKEASYSEFLPVTDTGGLDITFSAMNTYMKCPAKFKYSFIFKIPSKPTVNIRVGSLLHSVLEYFHKNYTREVACLKDLLKVFEDGWNMSRLPDSIQWRQFRAKAIAGLTTYFESFRYHDNTPQYFEKSFTLKVGNHKIRGRVDRIDMTPCGGYELIDYKTGRTWTQREVEKDLQLTVYTLGATESWGMKPQKASYYFILGNKRLSIEHQDEQLNQAKSRIIELAEGILAENFDAKPEYQNCRYCDFINLCNALERK